MTLKLAIPSKGRLQQQTIAWFSERGIEIARSGAERTYGATIDGIEGVSLVLLAAAEIPRELAAGRIHAGVTGQDLLREQNPHWPERVIEMAPLGFGFADLVVAVPAAWIDVTDMSDLDGAAAAFRAHHGHRLRVATKYHQLVRAFFRAHGVADYALVDSQGATEGAVKNLTAEAIADITTTGATLRDNHLRILDDGLILRSQAVLFLSRAADWTPDAARTVARLAARLGVEAPEGFPEG